jgi:hypothetical protein
MSIEADEAEAPRSFGFGGRGGQRRQSFGSSWRDRELALTTFGSEASKVRDRRCQRSSERGGWRSQRRLNDVEDSRVRDIDGSELEVPRVFESAVARAFDWRR